MSERLRGKVDRVIYRASEDDFAIMKIATTDGDRVVVRGDLFGVDEGDEAEFYGDWIIHPRYGKQFQVRGARRLLENTAEGLVNFLSSHRVKGIGKVKARAIVNELGSDCLDIIVNQPERLTKVKGISKRLAQTISEVVRKEYELATFTAELAPLGITANLSARLYDELGMSGIEKVKANPFMLTQIKGIGFKKADKIASQLGISKELPARIASGIFYLLEQALQDGNTYLPRDYLLDKACDLLDVEREQIDRELTELVREDALTSANSRIYLPSCFHTEQDITERIFELRDHAASYSYELDREQLKEVEAELGIDYTTEQREACLGALQNKVTIITGGPGTGKTTIIRGIISYLLSLGMRIELAAPTGRAARRLTELTGFPAQTIHRLLEYNPKNNSFRRNEYFPMDGEFIIIDEVSMVDLFLFKALLSACSPSARLLLVGDADQLPSVGPGRVLSDLIDSEQFPVYRLTKIHRQAKKSLIVRNAHRVRDGVFPIIKNRRSADFFFIREKDSDKGAELVESLMCERIPDNLNYDPFTEIQVLTPMYKGAVGADNLNQKLQRRLNPSSTGIALNGWELRVGDKVMQLKNNYEKGVFNGEIGLIIDVDADEGTVVVRFDHLIPYSKDELSELSLAYACTVHKSQGNEYPVVIMPLFLEHYIMLARNLLYTALTRAKKLAVLVGDTKALGRAVHNQRMLERFSGLIFNLKDSR